MQKNDATGWYANVSKDKNGQPEALNLGVVTIRPASVRFVEHRLVERSHNAFSNAKAAGRLHGPCASQAEAEKLLGIAPAAAPSAPPPAPPADDLPPVAPPEPEAPAAEEPPPAPPAEEAPPAPAAEEAPVPSAEGAPVSDSPSSSKPKKLGRR